MSEKDTNQQLTINQPAAAPAAPEKVLTPLIVADTTALSKVNTNLPRAAGESIPSNWEITPGKEDEIVNCYNIRTGRTFTGTMENFNIEFFK